MHSNRELYFKSHGGFMNQPIWQDDALFKLYHYCLYRATHKGYTWHKIPIEPGSFHISHRDLAIDLNWSRAKLERKLEVIADMGVVKLTKHATGTVLRMMGWSQYEANGGIETGPDRSRNETAFGLKMMPNWSRNGATPGLTARPAIDIDKYIDINQEKRTAPTNTTSMCESEPDGFIALWRAYPSERRSRRKEAVELFRKAIQDGATLETMLSALERDRATTKWLEDGGCYIPGIVTWLQRESWWDFVPSVKSEEDEEWKTR